ncbi:MAG: translation elongation factor Ts [Acidobacteriota bacterium]|nr:translation elongation factor Ts [Acidobacteriota bacterium]
MTVSAKLVKELRDRTGLGMMDCKKALGETNGDIEEAITYLRKKGMAKSAKLAGRIASEGTIVSYVHGGRIGVLLEVNCETDFTGRNDNFQALAKDIAMHIAAAKPRFLSREEVTQEILDKEREIAREQTLASGKPEHIVDKIVDGKMNKFFEENCLLEQYWVKENKKTIQDVVNEATLSIGEKITIRRFARYELGEGLEKRVDNFAEEVAKQAGGA